VTAPKLIGGWLTPATVDAIRREFMKGSAWLRPAVIGGMLGGMATMAVGFGEGGWLLGSSAERLADYRSAAAVTEALVSVCISQSRADPIFEIGAT
jgi:hypothetical protein